MAASAPDIRLLDQAHLDRAFGPSDVMTVTIELEPGSAGSPPHRHSGPVFGYLLEGELVFELEGEPERVIRVGEASGSRVATSSTTRPRTTSLTAGPSSWP